MTGPAPADRPLREQLPHLRLLERAAAAANQFGSLDEAGAAVLEEVCGYTGWPVGHLRVSAPPRSVWFLSDPERFSSLRPQDSQAGVGPAEQVLATGLPVCTTDVAPDLGVKAAFAAPVVVAGSVVAVLEFLSEQPAEPDDALLDLVSAVCNQLARVVERAQAGAALRQAEGRYRALAEATSDAVVMLDGRGTILSLNQGAEAMFGYPEAEVVGQPVTLLIPGRNMAAFFPTTGTTELSGVRRNGIEFPVEVSQSGWQTANGELAYTAVIRDITERRQAEEDRRAFEHQLAQRVLHDPLTLLPNRALLHDRLEHAAGRARRRGSRVAVVSIDINRFKTVNDSYGHQVGDQLLVAVATRLQGVARPDDTVARVGGDEFAMLCEDVADASEALNHARRIVETFRAPFVVDGREIAATASVGVAITSEDGAGPEQLLRDAERAVEQARGRGQPSPSLYEESMRADVNERLSIERDLRIAIRDGQLRLYYQPIVTLDGCTIHGVEALVRWEHPARGLLMPQEFIGPAEESGLIVPLGRWVLETACIQGASWQENLDRAEPFRISVNVSAQQFQHADWTEHVAHALLVSGLDPGRLVLEITESSLMEDTATTTLRLADLRALGVRIAIDDFGTGYSSLGYLRQFPVDILKVDKSFIDGVAEGPHDSALARAVIKLAATLNLDAVAEGVSTRRQVVALRRLRCRYAQGYFFSRPQPLEVMNALLGRRVLLGEGLDALEPEGRSPGA